MPRTLVRSLFLIALCAAGAAHAGTVYVPSPGLGSVGGSAYGVQIAATNTGAAAGVVKQALLATQTDGTQRPTPPSSVTVQAGQTAVVTAGSAFSGLIELAGTDGMRYSARLAGTGPGRLGAYLPVITSDNLIAGGKTASVQGFVSGSGRRADLTMVNLATVASQCTGALYLANGALLAGPATFNLKPLSTTSLTDVFTGGAAAEVRLTMTCTQNFFTYGLLSDAATGEVTYLGPSGNGASGIGGSTTPTGCPAGATCFDAKGIVHQPTPTHRVQRVMFPAPAGVATRLRLTLDVTVGPWYAPDPAGKTLIYWFVINRNFDMPGLLYFRGPDPAHPNLEQNQVIARHGIELTHPNKLKIQAPFAAVIGHTYHVDNDYDMGRGVYTVTVTDTATGDVSAQLLGTPNVHSWTLKASDNLLVDMGFTGTNPDEVPTDGWTYSNVHVEVYK